MKNTTLYTPFLLLISYATMFGQFKNKGILYVGDKTELYNNESFDFGIHTKTSKSVQNGLVTLSANALNAYIPSESNYVDGFIKIYPATQAAFYKIPLGFGSSYTPIGIFTTTAQPIVCVYHFANPTEIAPALDIEIDKISTTEYWKLVSTNSGKITLYWNENSSLSTILGAKPLDYLSVLGFNGIKWVALNSQVNPTLNAITTSQNIDLSAYSNFTIGARKDIACYTPVASSGIIKTWNGIMWSPSPPEITDPIIIDAPLSLSGNLECYSVQLNNNITLTDGQKIIVINGFQGAGKIIMTDLASIIQQNPTANPPKIQMTRIFKQMRRYDYAFLSNPTNDAEAFFNQIQNKQNVATNGNFGVQTSSAFNQLRTYDFTGLTPVNAVVANTPVGRGLSATVRSQSPYSTSNAAGAWFLQKEDIHFKIEGITNNGSYTMILPEINGYIRIGNPYPSPINGVKLMALAEGNLDKTMYYWTYHTERLTVAASSYNSADFATFNETGGTAAFEGGAIPDGNIGPMQAAFIRSIAPSITITIDNCVRFFDTPLPKAANSTNTNGKYRLNLNGSGNSFSQILIAYNATKGTLDYDNGYDSYRLSGNSSELSSLVNNYRVTIQTRPGFTVGDVVPLLLDKRKEETFTISLATTEGIFETTPIFLHDKTAGIYHDLTESSYSFIQNTEADTMRFEIVYQNGVLHSSHFDIKTAFAFIKNNEFHASANAVISEILIYDIAGRLIVSYSNLKTQSFTSEFIKAKGIYIAKIKLADGTVINQKLIQP